MEPSAYQQMYEIERHNWWFVARKEILDSLIEDFSSSKSEILEIGAGTGGNLEMLSKHGRVSAIEPDDFARKKIFERFGNQINLIKGELPNSLNLQAQSFDLICLFDVLEHVENDLLSLIAIKKFLKPNGKIILTVPAFQFLWSTHDVKLHHVRRYNLSGLKELISAADLQIVRITYFNFFLFPLAFFARLIMKIIPKKKLSSEKNLPNFLNKILTKIFASEKFLLKKNCNLPFGLSLLCVAQLKPKEN